MIGRKCFFLGMCVVLLATGCATGGSAEMHESLEGLRNDQRFMAEQLRAQNEKLAAIASRLEEMNARLAEAPVAPEAPTPTAAVEEFPNDKAVYAIPVVDAPRRGSDAAWVTLVVFSDFQCPFCSRVVDTLTALEKKYGADLRLAFHHLPLGFHQRARPAAIAAHCAHAQGRFWLMHDAIFENQRALEDDDLAGYAKAKQLDVKRWKKCVEGEETAAAVDADVAMAERFGVRGTPSFFINGRFFSGAQPLERFVSVVDAELARAKASGVAAKDYYAKVVMAGDPGRP